jgi:hypothetical protein
MESTNADLKTKATAISMWLWRYAYQLIKRVGCTVVGVSGHIRPFLEFLFGSAIESLLDGWFPLFPEDAIRLP